jgi:hypothetical protein
MQLFKFSLILLCFVQSSYAQKFSSKECLVSSFETEIKNDGKFFGLIKNNLLITKTNCEITVKYKNILETSWKVDICREPIHIKLNSKGTQTVHKRVKKCDGHSESDYCQYWSELRDTLQDYGLIYAEGEREKLTTSHGQVYCSFLLLNEYLDEGVLFSKYDEPKNLFSMTTKESCGLKSDSKTERESTAKHITIAPNITTPAPASVILPIEVEVEVEELKEEASF